MLTLAELFAAVIAHRTRALHANRGVAGSEGDVPPWVGSAPTLVVTHTLRVNCDHISFITLGLVVRVGDAGTALTVHVEKERSGISAVPVFGNGDDILAGDRAKVWVLHYEVVGFGRTKLEIYG